MDRVALLGEIDYFPIARIQKEGEVLERVRRTLARADYTEQGISRTLGIGYSYHVPAEWQAIFNRYFLTNEDPVHALIRLFYLNLPEREEAVAAVFEPEELRFLLDYRLLLRAEPGWVRAPVAIWPLRDMFIVTDHIFESDSRAANSVRRVMPLGGDSCSPALMAADAARERVLDLGTGSGVIALFAALSCERVVGVDINPRAVNFARFNALFNHVANCRFVRGDLYEPVAGEQFDLILANPPYVPTPKLGQLLFRDGGRGGEEVLSKVVAGCVQYLRSDGLCLIATILVDHRGIRYEEKVRRWLGGQGGFSCVIFKGPGRYPYQFALEHHEFDAGEEGYLTSLFRWIDQYRAEEIEQISLGYLAIKRTRGPSIAVRRVPISGYLLPDADYTGFTTHLVNCLDALDSPDRSSLSFGLNCDLSEATVSLTGSFMQEICMPYPVAGHLDALGDSIAVDRLESRLLESGVTVDDTQRAALEAFIAYLYLTGCLRLVGNTED